MSEPKDDYQLDQKIQIEFEGMPYWVMPRYRQHYVENSYERFSLRLICNLLNENSTLIDIGAHYGAYSLVAAKHCRSKVIALEPVEENFKLLTENITTNELGNKISAHKIAASDKEGMAEFNIPWASDSAGFYEHPLANTIKKQMVTMCRVDKLVGDQNIDLIKIDTEGHELHVLNGLKGTLKRNPKAKLLIEANPGCLKNAGATVKDLLTLLVDIFDKEVYVVNEEQFTLYRLTDNIDNWQEYIAEDGYANVLCVPKTDNLFAMFVCHSNNIGGAELAMVEHIIAQRAYNLMFHVLLPKNGGIESLLVNKGISYSVLPYYIWSDPANEQAVLPVMRRNEINLEAATNISILAQKLHIQFVANNTIGCPWGLPAAKTSQVPLVWFIHEFGDLDHRIPFLHNINEIRKFIVNESDLVICCSDAVRSVIEKVAPNKHTYTVYNVLDVDSIQQNAKQNGKSIFSNEAKIKLCIVGNVQANKGQITAIEAIAELKKQKVNAELAIIGPIDPDYLRIINELITSLGITKNIHLIGQQNNPHIFIEQSDIVLVCSVNEAFGRSTAEAMIIGRPVIGTASGGTLELIEDGVTGLLFAPGDVHKLASAINKLTDNKLATRLVNNAQKRIKALLNLEQNASKLNNLFRQLDYKRDRTYDNIFTIEWVNAVRQEIEEKSELQVLHDKSIKQNQFLEQSNEDLQKAVNELIEERTSITSSTSWRLTTPLRRGKSIVRQVKHKGTALLKVNNRSNIANAQQAELQYRKLTKLIKEVKRTKTTKIAVVLHLFYPELWLETYRDKIAALKGYSFDLFVTVPMGTLPMISDLIKNDFPKAYVCEVVNRGRDVLPFIHLSKSLRSLGYDYVLKLHSKKSPQRIDGQEWLNDMLNKLLPSNKKILSEIITQLAEPDTAIIGPSGHYISLPTGTTSQQLNYKHIHDIINLIYPKDTALQVDKSWSNYGYFEGTMFWLRLDAIEKLLDLDIKAKTFEPELGQTDGTLAHSLERIFCLCSEIDGKQIYEVNAEGIKKLAYKTNVFPVWSELYKGKRQIVTK
jgi:FkbM family methyltransferase